MIKSEIGGNSIVIDQSSEDTCPLPYIDIKRPSLTTFNSKSQNVKLYIKKTQIYETSKSFRLKHSLIKGRINEKILDIFVGKFTFLPNNKVIMQNCGEVQGTIQSCLTFVRYTITAKIEGQKVVFSLRIIFSKNILFKFWWYSYQYSKILLHGIFFWRGGGCILGNYKND